jgi:hypothetical protein
LLELRLKVGFKALCKLSIDVGHSRVLIIVVFDGNLLTCEELLPRQKAKTFLETPSLDFAVKDGLDFEVSLAAGKLSQPLIASAKLGEHILLALTHL